jgi:hypothetical protein
MTSGGSNPTGSSSGGLIGRVVQNPTSGPTVITEASIFAVIDLPLASRVGGLVGDARNEVQVSKSFVYAAIKGGSELGGLVGYSDGGLVVEEVRDSYAVILASDGALGGVAGIAKGASVTLSEVQFTTLLQLSTPPSTANYAGGLFGEASATTTDIVDVDVVVHIDVEARSVGGVVGYIDGSYELNIVNSTIGPLDPLEPNRFAPILPFIVDLIDGLDLPDAEDVSVIGTDRVGGVIGSINGSSTTSAHDVSIENTVVSLPLIATVGSDIDCLVGIEAPGGTLTIVGSFSTSTITDGDGVTTGCEPSVTRERDAAGTAVASFFAPGGVLPIQSPGLGEWVQSDGSSVPLAVSSPGVNQVRYSTDGIQVTFTGGAGSDASRGLVANPNGEIVCEVCIALAAGQVIEAWMFSEPRLVAAHLTQDLPCQRFSIPVVAPLDGGGPVSAGAHTLQLALPTASGMQAVNVGVTVGGPVPASVPAGEGPTVPLGLLALTLLASAGAVVAVRRQVVTA